MSNMKNSSVYAFTRILYSPFSLSKVIWTSAMFLGLSISIFKMVNFCYQYKQYPVIVGLSVIREQKLEFPAVTICNLNRMYSVTDKIGPSLMYSERRDLYYCKKCDNGSIISKIKNHPYLRFMKDWYRMDEKQRFANGHDPSMYIQECTFNGKMCLHQYLSNFSDIRYGNCVTFNKKAHINPLYISKEGVGNGLSLKLNLETCMYMEFTPTFGARLVIHEPDEIPEPEEKGYIVTPSYETFVGMKQTVFKRLPAPYKDQCVDYKARHDFIKSYNECIKKCIQMRNVRQCGCIDPTFKVMSDFKSCDLSNEAESCCLDDVLEHMSQAGPTCHCPKQCSSISYGEQLSMSVLPSVYYKSMVDCPKYVEARINIFYSSLEKLVYEQTPRWELFEFLSILGNEFGLWLGSSLVVFVEIVEKLVFICKTKIDLNS